MPEASRKGRRIASKACDLCRERKIQCVFEHENAGSCQKCIKSRVPCTFLTDRKPRGPPSKRVAEARQRAALAGHSRPDDAASLAAAPGDPSALPLPILGVSVEHLVPEDIFRDMINDFVDRVYPVLPLVHLPSFLGLVHSRQYLTQPPVFRLCLAVCTVTMASIPRRIDTYDCLCYKGVGEFVDRASQMVTLSRMASDPAWPNRADPDSLVVSVLMAMASHYSERHVAGWSYTAEATQFFRDKELYRMSAYSHLTCIEAEMCKRCFWLLYIMQVHDRISSGAPHTGLSYDPVHTDWDFLVPMDISDEDLVRHAGPLPPPLPPDAPTPSISGFIALTHIFLTVGDIVSRIHISSPPHYAISAGTLLSHDRRPHASSPPSVAPPSIEVLYKVIRRLHTIRSELPSSLKLAPRPPLPALASDAGDAGRQTPLTRRARYFEIMRVNIHVTSLYFQSALLEICLTQLRTNPSAALASWTYPPTAVATMAPFNILRPQSPSSAARARSSTGSDIQCAFPAAVDSSSRVPLCPDPATMDPSLPNSRAIALAAARIQLWEFRESLARELLGVVTLCSRETLEANGYSMIAKIREIAASLLDNDERELVGPNIAERNRLYVGRFVEILAKLDYAARNMR